MFKRSFFLIIAATAVLIGATSCDKDTFLKTETLFYRFVDANHINIYDGGGISIEEGRDMEIHLHTQLLIPFHYGDEPLKFKPDETGVRYIALAGQMYDDESTDYKAALNSLEYTFHFNLLDLTIRMTDFNINDPDNDRIYICLDGLILKAEIKPLVQTEVPFSEKGEIIYTLITRDTNIVIATAKQDYENLPPNNPSGKGGSEGGGDM